MKSCKMKPAFFRVFLVLVLLMLPFTAKVRAEEDEEATKIYYFHETSCASCDGTSEFFEIFNEQVGDIKENYRYQIIPVNVFPESGREQFLKILAGIGLTREDVSLPCMVIGEDTASGQEEIRENLRELFIKYGEGYEAHYVDPGEEQQENYEDAFYGVQTNPDAHTICFFYTLSCDDCARVERFLEELPEEYEGSPVEVQSYCIAEADGMEKIRLMFDTYGVGEEDQRVPIIFYKDGYLSGGDVILKELKSRLEDNRFKGFAYPSGAAVMDAITIRDLPAIGLTGLINGFNPCSISILFLLLSLIVMDKKRILKVGFTFMAGKYLAYFLLGIGLYSLVSVINFVWIDTVRKVLNIILIGAALYLAFLNLLDFFAVRREEYGKVRAQLPERFRRFNNNMVKKVLKNQNHRFILLAIFLASIVISAGEFLCTGQIYLGTIIYMLERGTESRLITIAAFLVYITAMCLPQCLMILAVRGGANIMSLTDSTRRRFPIIKLVNCLVFLIFAALMIWMTFLR